MDVSASFRRVLPVALCAGALLAGCSEQRGSGPRGSSGVVLTYWPAPNPQEILLADSLVRVWNRLHPEIRVEMQPIPVSISTEEVLLAAIAGKTTPTSVPISGPGRSMITRRQADSCGSTRSRILIR